MSGTGYIAVSAKQAGFRRVGRAWSAAPTVVAVDEFTDAQLELLRNDPGLVVVPAEPPKESDGAADNAETPAEAAPENDLATAEYLSVTPRVTWFRRAGRRWPAGATVVAASEFSADQLAALIDDPSLVVVASPTPPSAEGRAATLLDAVRQLTEKAPRDDADWLKSGKPRVEAIESVTGLPDVTGAERDAAWDAHQAA